MAPPSFYQAVHISELFADATRRAFGVSFPVGQDLAVPSPAFEPMSFSDGEVTVSSVAGGTRKDLLPRPLRLVRAVWSKLPRYPVDAPCSNEEGLQYRAACLRDFLGPVQRTLKETPELAPFIVAQAASFGRGAVAMPAAEVVNFLVTHGIEREGAERAVREVEERGAVHEYDAVGRAFVAGAKERAEAEARAAADARVRAQQDDEPNDVTIGQLEWVCITRDTRVSQRNFGLVRTASTGRFQPSEYKQPARRKDESESDHQARCEVGLRDWKVRSWSYKSKSSADIAQEVDDGALVAELTGHLAVAPFTYTFIPRAAFLGVDLDDLPMPPGVSLEKPSFVPCGSRLAVRKLRARVEAGFYGSTGEPQEKALVPVRWLLELRARGAEARSAEYDETTEDGRHRVELYEGLLGDAGAHFPSSKDARFGTAMRLLFDAGYVGLSLADDVAADALQRAVVKHCKVPPPWAATRESVLSEARRMRAKRAAEVFAPDDFYTLEEPGILERAAGAIFGGDPWRAIVESAIEGKALATNEDIVEALRAAEVDGEELASSKRDQRIFRVMTALGFEKKSKRIDGGEPRRVWVRTSGASA